MTGEPVSNAARQRAYRSRIAARNERRLRTLRKIDWLVRESRDPDRRVLDQVWMLLKDWRIAEEGER
jgi:hypothetical protein